MTVISASAKQAGVLTHASLARPQDLSQSAQANWHRHQQQISVKRPLRNPGCETNVPMRACLQLLCVHTAGMIEDVVRSLLALIVWQCEGRCSGCFARMPRRQQQALAPPEPMERNRCTPSLIGEGERVRAAGGLQVPGKGQHLRLGGALRRADGPPWLLVDSL